MAEDDFYSIDNNGEISEQLLVLANDMTYPPDSPLYINEITTKDPSAGECIISNLYGHPIAIQYILRPTHQSASRVFRAAILPASILTTAEPRWLRLVWRRAASQGSRARLSRAQGAAPTLVALLMGCLLDPCLLEDPRSSPMVLINWRVQAFQER